MAITHVDSNTSPSSYPGSSNNTDTIEVVKPTGLQQGDFMIAFLQAGGVSVNSAPSGWTLHDQTSHGSQGAFNSWIYYKFAGASEPADYTWNLSGGDVTPAGGAIAAFRGVSTNGPINAYEEAESQSTENKSTPSATTSSRCLMLHYRLVRHETSITTIGDFTGDVDSMDRRFLVGNRGASTAYFAALYTDGNTVVEPGSQSGVSMNSTKTVEGSFERQIGLRESWVAGHAAVTVQARSVTGGTDLEVVVGHASADVEAHNATVQLTGDVEVYPDVANVDAIAHDAMGYFGAPEERSAYVPFEDRTYEVTRD